MPIISHNLQNDDNSLKSTQDPLQLLAINLTDQKLAGNGYSTGHS